MRNVGKGLKTSMQNHHLTEQYQKLLQSVYADPDVQEFVQEHQEDLAPQAVQKSASKLYEFVNEKKKMAAGQTTFAPGYAPQLVVNDHLIEVAYQPTKDFLRRQRDQRMKNNFVTVGMTPEIKRVNFEDYDPTPDQEEVIIDLINFIENYENDPQEHQKSVYLYGPFGVGKTFVMAAMAHRLSDHGVKTMLVHFPSFAVELKNAIGDNTFKSKVDQVKKMPVLIIDDIGADSMSAWIRDDVLGVILEYRMQNQLSTFFTSNFSMDELAKEHLAVTARNEAEPLKAQRLMERIKFLARPVYLNGNNLRN
ncbi:primosomal protein DnaI [Fructilactobacillus cliffordii]|uniref:primosomal protein DnaI n=1 Tax=Fructilactobacillus cliffordii TaxID=2940299 RepID=UPI002092B8EC|nr:primosomal protein DnaI [Fructilactobacillus cliffordii]USS86749.1 primosomal protein DnaI [Fructilactobacillus cliffordii]